MKHPAGAVILILAALAAFGCGSSESRDESELLPRALGANLLGRSERVRATLERGDGCTALREANRLRSAVARAIDDGRVPLDLQRELRRRATGLADSIVCVRPPLQPQARADEVDDDDDDDHGKKKGRGKKGRGKNGDHGREDD